MLPQKGLYHNHKALARAPRYIPQATAAGRACLLAIGQPGEHRDEQQVIKY